MAWAAAETTPGWTVADHVGHLAAWFDEAAAAIAEHRPGEAWRPLPPEGVDAWNAADAARAPRHPARRRCERRSMPAATGSTPAVRAMPDDEWLDPEGFSWAYEDLHGHVRAHLAMIGPYAARARWPTG